MGQSFQLVEKGYIGSGASLVPLQLALTDTVNKWLLHIEGGYFNSDTVAGRAVQGRVMILKNAVLNEAAVVDPFSLVLPQEYNQASIVFNMPFTGSFAFQWFASEMLLSDGNCLVILTVGCKDSSGTPVVVDANAFLNISGEYAGGGDYEYRVGGSKSK